MAAIILGAGASFAGGPGHAAEAREGGWLSSWPSFSWPWSSPEKKSPAGPALEESPEAAEKGMVGYWRAMLVELRPESKGLIESTAVSFVSSGVMRERTGRDSEAHYDWKKSEVLVNRRLISRLRAEVAALVGEEEADKKLAVLTLHILDHEITGHAGAVAGMREKYGRYVGMVLEEENYSYMTEAVGIARCYSDDYCRRGMEGIRELVDKRHTDILKAIPGGVEAFDKLVKSKRYHLPSADEKAREYLDSAADIESRLSRSQGNSSAVARRRANAENLLRFYREAFRDFSKALKAIKPS